VNLLFAVLCLYLGALGVLAVNGLSFWDLFLLIEFERNGIDAITQSGRVRTIIEHMA
jgi:hypothetical protein